MNNNKHRNAKILSEKQRQTHQTKSTTSDKLVLYYGTDGKGFKMSQEMLLLIALSFLEVKWAIA